MAATKSVQSYLMPRAIRPASSCPSSFGGKLESERETAYLLKSKTMRTRLLEAKARKKGISLEHAQAQLGI